MTHRADEAIEQLSRRLAEGEVFTPGDVARDLRAQGWSPTETGWVLRHVFRISMPEAVHIASQEPK